MTDQWVRRRHTDAFHDDDRGFGLVDLAVYIVLLGIVTAIVAAVVMTSFQAEQTVSSTTNIANDAQTVVATLDRDLRNAQPESVTAVDTSSITLLTARTSGDFCWQKIMWSFAGDEVLRSANGDPDNLSSLLSHPVANGSFSVAGDQIGYTFDLSGERTADKTISGVVALGPAGQEGELC